MARAAVTATGPRSIGRYRLVERLGAGGMAEVWRCELSGPGGFKRSLVLKLLLPHLAADSSFVEMFLTEGRLYAMLDHPNIVQVFELGEEDGTYFMAMEQVRGFDLVAVMRALAGKSSAAHPAFAAYVVRDVCRALGYAHSFRHEKRGALGLIHRDVSPSNIMIAVDGRVKLLDFGVAKALAAAETSTRPGMLKGKVSYMSPQQAAGAPIDRRSDLFSAGIVLWEVGTGHRLFRTGDAERTLALIQAAEVDAPSSRNPAVSRAFDRIALRALARDPDDRYATAEEMRADLDELVHELGFDAVAAASFLAANLPPVRTSEEAEPTATSSLEGVVSRRTPAARPARRVVLYAAIAAAVILATGVGAMVRSRPNAPVTAAVVTSTRLVTDSVAPRILEPTMIDTESPQPFAKAAAPAGPPLSTPVRGGQVVRSAKERGRNRRGSRSSKHFDSESPFFPR